MNSGNEVRAPSTDRASSRLRAAGRHEGLEESKDVEPTTLLQEAIAFARTLARDISRQLDARYTVDELQSFAHEAVLELVARFDPSQGSSFRGFARLRLRGAIFDGIRRDEGLPRGVAARLRALQSADLFVETQATGAAAPTLRAQEADARLQRFLRGVATAYALGALSSPPDASWPRAESHRADDPESEVNARQTRGLLESAIGNLEPTQATLLRLHYFDGHDLAEAAARLRLSKSWGSRLHARAIEQLADTLCAARRQGDL